MVYLHKYIWKDRRYNMELTPKLRRKDAIISESLDDVSTPGVIVEVDPEAADRLGAFEEDALDEETAWDANADLWGFEKWIVD
jgi:hypothetical protein